MKRRDFVKFGLISAGIAASPYILPSGRLFASSGKRKANHVVFCLFAGGVRNIESVQMSEGNLMPFTLKGNHSISSDILSGMSKLPIGFGKTLQEQGTLFKEFRFSKGSTGHVPGLVTAITGNYFTGGVSAKKRTTVPTLFELYRKHSSPEKSALNAWFVADRSDPMHFFNYSEHPVYGHGFGGNFIHPFPILGRYNKSEIGDPYSLKNKEEQQIIQIAEILDKHFVSGKNKINALFHNSPEDAEKISAFIKQSNSDGFAGLHNDPWKIGEQVMNSDCYNIHYAELILKEFQPELLFVNMLDIDKGHTDFTVYCDNIRKADYALSHLWNTIQSTPGLRNDTVLIAVPEHGRNLIPNSIRDSYGRLALDHTSDETSREIFCLVLGPENVIRQNVVIPNIVGESIDVVPTIADILGFRNEIEAPLKGRVLEEVFV